MAQAIPPAPSPYRRSWLSKNGGQLGLHTILIVITLIFLVPLMVVIGIPLYGGAPSVLPLVQTLAASGVPVGTLLALMMSVIALSLPEMILLKRVMNLKLLATFVGIVAVSIIAVGYLLNGWI